MTDTAGLVMTIEQLQRDVAGFQKELTALADDKTAAEVSEARMSADKKAAEEGLLKYEELSRKQSAEIAELKRKLKSEVKNCRNLVAQSERDQAQLGKYADHAQNKAGATGKSLKESEERERQAQAQIKELSATGVQLRDDKAALTVSLQETQAALRKEQGKREAFELEARQLRQDLELLQGSVPAQVSALSDARTAAQTEALLTRQKLSKTEGTLADCERALTKSRESYGALERQNQSDSKAMSVERARLEGEVSKLKQSVQKLKTANATGDRSLLMEARAKKRSDSEGRAAAAKGQEYRDRANALTNRLRETESKLTMEKTEHKVCKTEREDLLRQVRGLTRELDSERNTTRALQIDKSNLDLKATKLDTKLKKLSSEVSKVESSRNMGMGGLSQGIGKTGMPSLSNTKAMLARANRRRSGRGKKGKAGKAYASPSSVRKKARASAYKV